MADGVYKSAVISDCEAYRYRLNRIWRPDAPSVCFIMLNPSTADANIDDATIRSCCRLARSWNYGGITVVNLFAFRSTDPNGLLKADNPVGPLNNEFIRGALVYCDFVVCAWGAHKSATPKRTSEVLTICRQYDRVPHCLGTTKSGAPKHPLYIKTGTTPEVYRNG